MRQLITSYLPDTDLVLKEHDIGKISGRIDIGNDMGKGKTFGGLIDGYLINNNTIFM